MGSKNVHEQIYQERRICMKEKFLRFMQGRYGVDQFSKGLLIAGLVVVLLSSFLQEEGQDHYSIYLDGY